MWLKLERDLQMPQGSVIHPYVQSPLWAYALQPLCTRVNFAVFNALFLAAVSLALAATIGFVAWAWAGRLFHPAWLALLCASIYQMEAYKYTMLLAQTHIIFVLLAIVAIFCASQRRSGWAGALLAVAAAVKITPAFLVFYWLAKRDWRASVSFAAFSLGIALLSLLAVGPSVELAYLHNLAQISNVLLVSWNNQSLAGWWMSARYPPSEQAAWHSFPLPAALKWTCTLLSLAAAVLGGLLDRGSASRGSAPPYGAALALIASTIFAPIAWTHYYVLLAFPLILLLNRAIAGKSRTALAFVLLIFALNFNYDAAGGILKPFVLFPLARPEFLSGLPALASLAGFGLLARREKRKSAAAASG